MPLKARANSIPKYRRQKRPGGRDHGFVELAGRRFYLGSFGTPQSIERYHRLLAERSAGTQAPPRAQITVIEVIARFWQHCESYYLRPDGRPTSEVDNFRQALRPLRSLYGYSCAAAFGPGALKTARQWMVEQGWCRTNINKQVNRLRQVFKWAVEAELVPPSVHQALACVAPLKRGRCDARESKPTRPVPQAHIDAVRPYLSRHVWALIQLQLLSAARPGELVALRALDIQMNGSVWKYQMADHKTAHHGHTRTIYFGPQAQSVLRPFLNDRAIDQHFFSPRSAQRERAERAMTHRRADQAPTPRETERRVGDHYTVASYRRAITRACDLAFPHPQAGLRRQSRADGTLESEAELRTRLQPAERDELRRWREAHRWHPHQLRHNAATRIREEFGIEAAQVILGHATLRMTELYAELQSSKAIAIAAATG